MKIRRGVLKLSLVFGVLAFTACTNHSQSITPAFEKIAVVNQVKPQKKFDPWLRIKTKPSSGSWESLFVRVDASNSGAKFIKQKLTHHLTELAEAQGAPLKFHTTLIEVDANLNSPLIRREEALKRVQDALVDFLQDNPTVRPLISFETEAAHTFPQNFRFLALTPTPSSAALITQLQHRLYLNAEDTITRQQLRDVLTISELALPQNYFPHMTIYKTPLGSPVLNPVTLHALSETVSQRLTDLRSLNEVSLIPFETIVLSN